MQNFCGRFSGFLLLSLVLPMQLTAKEAAKSKEVKSEAKESENDYNQEIMASVDFQRITSTLNRSGDTASTAVSQGYTINVRHGLFMGDNFEPFYEISYDIKIESTDDVPKTTKDLGWGIGALFNIPIVRDGAVRGDKGNAPALAVSNWIPYGGIVVSSMGNNGTVGSVSATETGIHTSLILGSRYIIYPHVSVQSSLRFSYEKSSNLVIDSGQAGGELSKVTLKINLLSFSVLF